MNKMRVVLSVVLLMLTGACVDVDNSNPPTDRVSSQLHEVVSEFRSDTVPVSVLLPPNFDIDGPSLPLLIHLHGGGGDRNTLLSLADNYSDMFNRGILPPMVVVSFSGGPTSFYYGTWEQFVVDELPNWAGETFGVLTDPDHLIMTGISMGGYGSLKIGFKFPERFKAI
ncbi:MAG: alpha/beta hydrolase-fold protein, partial [Pseudomonadales bacterium]